MNPDLKVYASVIEIDGNGNELRNGMSCQVEIVVEYFPEALYVPVQAVIQVGGNPTVYVKEGQKFMPRQIKIGLDNNRMIRVVEGVALGEVVLLTPPLAAGERKPETAPPPEMLESGAAVKTEAQQNSPGQQPTKPPADNRQPKGRRP
jgi:hypothetical protein